MKPSTRHPAFALLAFSAAAPWASAQLSVTGKEGRTEVAYTLRLGDETNPVRFAQDVLVDQNLSPSDASFAVSSGLSWFSTASSDIELSNVILREGIRFVIRAGASAQVNAPNNETATADIAVFGRGDYTFTLQSFRASNPLSPGDEFEHNLIRVFDEGGVFNAVLRGPLNVRGLEPIDVTITTADVRTLSWRCTPAGGLERVPANQRGGFLIPGDYEFYLELSDMQSITVTPPNTPTGDSIAFAAEATFLIDRQTVNIPPCFDLDGDPSRLSNGDVAAWVQNPVDLNADGVIDQNDPLFLSYLVETVGFGFRDCNRNGLSDAYEIAAGLVLDEDNNNFPDSCQVDICSPADIDFNNRIDVFDLIAFLQSFSVDTEACIGNEGPVPCGPSDVHPLAETNTIGGDGIINVFDLITFLQNFNPDDPNCQG